MACHSDEEEWTRQFVMERMLVRVPRVFAAASFLPFFKVFLAMITPPRGYPTRTRCQFYRVHAGLQSEARVELESRLKTKELKR